jgi:hypothetical protein
VDARCGRRWRCGHSGSDEHRGPSGRKAAGCSRQRAWRASSAEAGAAQRRGARGRHADTGKASGVGGSCYACRQPCGPEQAQAAGRANTGRMAREHGGRWRRGWRRARVWLGRSRSSMGTAGGVREQERAGAGVDAARAGGVTLTRERYAGSKRQLGTVQGSASRGGSARRRRAAAPEWMRRQVLARRGDACGSGAASGVGATDRRAWRRGSARRC